MNHHLTRVVNGNNYHLLHFETRNSDEVSLRFSHCNNLSTTVPSPHSQSTSQGTYITCGKSLILAVPPPALKSVKLEYYHLPTAFHTHLSSVNAFSALKIFLGFQEAWWRNTSDPWRVILSDLPISLVEETSLRQQSDPASSPIHVLSVTIDRASHVAKWQKMLNQGPSGISDMAEQISRQLQRISRRDAPLPEILSLGYYLWDAHSNPAWYSWKPGIDRHKALDHIKQPMPSERLYVVGSAWAPSHMQSTLEASLESVDDLLGYS